MRQLFWIVFVFALYMPVSINAQTCGNTNIAQGKAVTVLNQWQYAPASDAVDGNISTRWAGHDLYTGDTNYIYVDLAQSYTLCKIKIYWESNGAGKNYLAQTSTDATNWTTIFTRTNNAASTDSFNVVGTGRYLRIYITAKINSWGRHSISELQVFNNLSNFHPSVSLTAPAANFKTFAGNNIKLTASAADSDGFISKVAFYQDTVKLGEVTTPPYEFTWVNVQAGQYALRAKAYDNSNADSLSVPVNITVNTSNRWSISGNSGTNVDSNFIGTTDIKNLSLKPTAPKR